MTKIVLPELGEGVTTATVSFWFFKVGDTVKENDELVELTTEKAAFNLPSPAAGRLTQISVSEGNAVKVGETLGIIE